MAGPCGNCSIESASMRRLTFSPRSAGRGDTGEGRGAGIGAVDPPWGIGRREVDDLDVAANGAAIALSLFCESVDRKPYARPKAI